MSQEVYELQCNYCTNVLQYKSEARRRSAQIVGCACSSCASTRALKGIKFSFSIRCVKCNNVRAFVDRKQALLWLDVHPDVESYSCVSCKRNQVKMYALANVSSGDSNHRSASGGKHTPSKRRSTLVDIVSLSLDSIASIDVDVLTKRALNAWSHDIRERDCHVCKACGASDDLHAHHIIPMSCVPMLAFLHANGVTLCNACHSSSHGVHGDSEPANDIVKELRRVMLKAKIANL